MHLRSKHAVIFCGLSALVGYASCGGRPNRTFVNRFADSGTHPQIDSGSGGSGGSVAADVGVPEAEAQAPCGPGLQRGPGGGCVPVPACTPGGGGCGAHASCTGAGASARCVCDSGFKGDGQTCTDVDECGEAGACDPNATCTNTDGGFSCACNAGWSGDGHTCTDVNECTEGGACDPNATCTNTDGGYACVCNAGWAGDGHTCTDVNECAADAGTGDGGACDPNATCTNTDGGFGCVCNAGFTGDGHTCTDVDECAPGGTSNCDQNAACQNTPGSFTCTCNGGFTGNGQACTSCLGAGVVPTALVGTVPLTVNGALVAGTSLFDGFCWGGLSAGPEQIYSFTAPAAGTYSFDTYGSTLDTVVYVMDPANACNQLMCNDDSGAGLESFVGVAMTSGQTVFVVVDGYSSSQTGDFTLHVTSGCGAEFACADQYCVAATSECDTVGDCPDSSDELPTDRACVPAGWNCAASFYYSGLTFDCDCGCGLFDPDCADATSGSCDWCGDSGSCCPTNICTSISTCPGTISSTDNSTCN